MDAASQTAIGAGNHVFVLLLGIWKCVVFFCSSDSHHVRRHLEKSRREKKEPAFSD
jgi:hypothetical protein